MAAGWKMELYWRLPVPLQELGLSLYARWLDRMYYGPKFDQACESMRASHWDSQAEIVRWQLGQFRTMLSGATAHVDYYRDALRGLIVDEIRSLETLRSLPFLDRQLIRQRERLFVDDRLNLERLYQNKTSGSTGTAVTVYWSREALQRFWAAFEVRVRNAAGVSRHAPRAMLGGRPIVPGATRSPPFWRHNRFWRQLYLSSYHVSRSTASGYVAALRESGVEWLTGYGSAIAALAESATAEGIEPIVMKCVIVSGDTLQPGMRNSIESFFQCKCYDSYGQVEGVSMAMECREGRLHLVPEVGIVEIVRPDGRSCGPGEIGEMVATGLINDAMPLIRYRTGDYAALAADQRCPCGSPHPIIESLEGRVDDYLVTSDGRRIGRLSTAMKRSPRCQRPNAASCGCDGREGCTTCQDEAT